MKDYIEVTRLSQDGLSRHVWRFWKHHLNETIYVDGYRFETRPTRRHGFRLHTGYVRTSNRRYEPGESLSYKEVPLPEGVVVEARSKFCDQITFGGEYKR